jgi:hypothetical protein
VPQDLEFVESERRGLLAIGSLLVGILCPQRLAARSSRLRVPQPTREKSERLSTLPGRHPTGQYLLLCQPRLLEQQVASSERKTSSWKDFRYAVCASVVIK